MLVWFVLLQSDASLRDAADGWSFLIIALHNDFSERTQLWIMSYESTPKSQFKVILAISQAIFAFSKRNGRISPRCDNMLVWFVLLQSDASLRDAADGWSFLIIALHNDFSERTQLW